MKISCENYGSEDQGQIPSHLRKENQGTSLKLICVSTQEWFEDKKTNKTKTNIKRRCCKLKPPTRYVIKITKQEWSRLETLQTRRKHCLSRSCPDIVLFLKEHSKSLNRPTRDFYFSLGELKSNWYEDNWYEDTFLNKSLFAEHFITLH